MGVGPREPRWSAERRVGAREGDCLAPGWGLRPFCPCCFMSCSPACCSQCARCCWPQFSPSRPSGGGNHLRILRPRAAAPVRIFQNSDVFHKKSAEWMLNVERQGGSGSNCFFRRAKTSRTFFAAFLDQNIFWKNLGICKRRS